MNIFISNLSFAVESQDLNELFEEYGEVSSAKVITDRVTGKSRGFGFVEMPNDAEAQKAIDALNQVEYDHRVISVSVARPKTEQSGSGRSSYGSSNNYRSERRSNY